MKKLLFKIVKPFLKRAVKKVIQGEGDRLQAKLKKDLEAKGPDSLNRAIDKAQAFAMMKIENSFIAKWVPGWALDEIHEAIQEQGDKLQESLVASVSKFGPAGIDKVFDAAQKTLLERIDAL